MRRKHRLPPPRRFRHLFGSEPVDVRGPAALVRNFVQACGFVVADGDIGVEISSIRWRSSDGARSLRLAGRDNVPRRP